LPTPSIGPDEATGNGKAAITGDFLVTDSEVNPLIRALRAGDIEVTAIHSHMLDEQTHRIAKASAEALARYDRKRDRPAG
jgi:hypothetical protein